MASVSWDPVPDIAVGTEMQLCALRPNAVSVFREDGLYSSGSVPSPLGSGALFTSLLLHSPRQA